jgi:hypothetical protein
MDKFGEHWRDHPARIEAAWREYILPQDLVLVPGDFSWAMKMEEAAIDFEWLARLPGKKILIKGNHDYWWPKTRAKMAALLPPDTYALKRNALILEGLAFVGVRGADFFPAEGQDPQEAAAELEREVHEFRLSIDHLKTLDRSPPAPIALFHYPPLPAGATESIFTRLIEDAGIRRVVYGHLHSPEDWDRYFQGCLRGVDYHLVSCDYLGFKPLLLEELSSA